MLHNLNMRFKVDEGHDFQYQSKPVYDFLSANNTSIIS